jgi:transcriptional regulator of heat shock response
LNDNNKYQLSIISPTRADYQQIKALLNFVNEEIEKIARQKNNEK